MTDILITAVLAIILTAIAVVVLELERAVGVIGVTFGMCVLVSGILVRVIVDARTRKRNR